MNETFTPLKQVKQFLLKNFIETRSCVAKIFNISRETLRDAIKREDREKKTFKSREKQNKILNERQIEAIHTFIRSLFIYNISLIKPLIFNVIRHLKRVETLEFQGFSKRWFRSWWKISKLHIIKNSSLEAAWFTASRAADIEKWFKDYRIVLNKLKTKAKNIINFDETRFQVECSKKRDVLVSEDIKSFYVISLENRRSLTVIEMINVVDNESASLMLIIQSQELMTNWFAKELL